MYVSIDQRRAVQSAEADKRYLGGAAEPLRGSNAHAYTGPPCPTSFRVVAASFSLIFFNDEAEEESVSLRYSRNDLLRNLFVHTIGDRVGVNVVPYPSELFSS